MPLAQVQIGYSTNFLFLKKCNLIEFSMTKNYKIQYLPYLKSKHFQITFIKSYSQSFPTIPRVCPSSQ
jgi:hypothetical protein